MNKMHLLLQYALQAYGTDPYAPLTAGIAALWGPAHGGANEACLNMLKQIADIQQIPHYLERAKDKNDSFV